jgi:hypothetical protein
MLCGRQAVLSPCRKAGFPLRTVLRPRTVIPSGERRQLNVVEGPLCSSANTPRLEQIPQFNNLSSAAPVPVGEAVHPEV